MNAEGKSAETLQGWDETPANVTAIGWSSPPSAKIRVTYFAGEDATFPPSGVHMGL